MWPCLYSEKCPKPKRWKILSVGKSIEKWELSYVAGGNVKGYCHFGKQFGRFFNS